MTVEMCLKACHSKKYAYFGLQWQIECYCGNKPVKRFEWAWPDKCDDRCAGNPIQICGGSRAMSVYSTPGKIHQLCLYDFPSPYSVLDDLSITGDRNMTIQKCKNLCTGIPSKDICYILSKNNHRYFLNLYFNFSL